MKQEFNRENYDCQQAPVISQVISGSTEGMLRLTRYKNNKGHLTKEMALDNGQIMKKAAANLFDGMAERMEITLEQFVNELKQGDHNAAFGYGVYADCYPRLVQIATKDKVNVANNVLARSKDHFRYDKSPGILMLDHDPSQYGQSCSPEMLVSILEQLMPGFADCAYIVKGSVSARVTSVHQQPSDNAGYHLYVPVKDASDIPRFGRALFERLWLMGQGYIALASNGAMLTRAAIDGSVFSPERIDFTAHPKLMAKDLMFHYQDPVYKSGYYLDTQCLKSLNDIEKQQLLRLQDASKNQLQVQSLAKRESWKFNKVKELIQEDIAPDKAKQIVDQLVGNDFRKLSGDYVLHFDEMGKVMIREVFHNPALYDGKTLSDPVEGPTYGKNKAILYWNDGKRPSIYSYAHGGQVYWLYETATEELLEANRNGKYMATLSNVNYALHDAHFCGFELAYDEFRGIEMFRINEEQPWQPIKDSDVTNLCIKLERKEFMSIPSTLMSKSVGLYAYMNRFDSAIDWVNGLKWDGVPRVTQFLTQYFSTENTPYAKAVSEYLWTALAGRVLQPAVKADMVPIAIGDQGCGKSSGVAAMVPWEDAFSEIDLGERDADLSRKIMGLMIAELSELRGLRDKDSEAIKQFITKRYEHWVPKYQEKSVTHARRLILFGTTNETEFLVDPSGNRRYLPIVVGQVDRNAIVRDRNQLWAEAAVMFRENGIHYKDAETLAKVEIKKYLRRDPWEDAIVHGIHSANIDVVNNGISTTEILTNILNMPLNNLSNAQNNRVNDVMRRLGYQSRRNSVDRSRRYRWINPSGNDKAA